MAMTDAGMLKYLPAQAHALADAARPLSLLAFRQPLRLCRKDDGSPVTAADLAVEQCWRTLLHRWHPEHGILGEELGRTGLSAPWASVLDPIDGTASYVCGHCSWGSLIALLHHGQPVLGLIDAPALDERWAACFGGPALWWTGSSPPRPCRTSGVPNLASARLSAALHGSSTMHRSALDRLAAQVAVHHLGGDCISHALLATGQIDLVAETGLDDFDVMALVPVVTAAGGVITDWNGRPPGLGSDGTVLSAAHAALHRQALALLRPPAIP
jgi:histidinol phosphatase-like enzyme (inositol monophosphatase family)